MSSRKPWIPALLLLAIVFLPYLFAALPLDPRTVFGGFLFNPADSNSYLAKMLQGWSGSWRFVLPYTAEPGEGAYLFLFYLFLGHLSRWLHLPLVVTYHLARALSVLWLVFALSRFFSALFPQHPRFARIALYLSILGSGLGWVAVLAGTFTSDLWVAEAYPFLSSYANPHFPLGLALLLDLMLLSFKPMRGKQAALLAVGGLLLAVAMPFGLVVLAVICGGLALWELIETHHLAILKYLVLFMPGGCFLLYQFWVAQTDPVLAGWNAQNITTSPPVWDFVLSFSPALLLGVFGARPLYTRRAEPAVRAVLVWLVLGFILVYVPFSLQRRFMLGYSIPVTGLGVAGLAALLPKLRVRRWVVPVLFLTSVLTNAGVLMAGVGSVLMRDEDFYLRRGEVDALTWIKASTEPRALILTSPGFGMYIPAHTGRRVLYGHPFETVNAVAEEEALEAFFGSQISSQQKEEYLRQRGVDYVLSIEAGHRQSLAEPALDSLSLVYENDSVKIYRVVP